MPTNIKVILGFLVLAIVVGGGYWWYASTKTDPAPSALTEGEVETPPAHTLPSGSDTSDDALQRDAASVDADLSAMTADTAAIDAGLNDKEITQ